MNILFYEYIYRYIYTCLYTYTYELYTYLYIRGIPALCANSDLVAVVSTIYIHI
jgi:hypothetical protein